MPRFVTFTKWCVTKSDRVPVTINPEEVSDIEDYCGSQIPGSKITLKNKKTYLVYGVHADIVADLKKDSTG
jgi:hypothetical protein